MIDLPWKAMRAALDGGLSAGVHAITGPIGSGKTQLALQIATHGAELGLDALLCHPAVHPDEIRSRIGGIRSKRPWRGQSVSSMPPGIGLGTASPAQILETAAATIVIIDHPSAGDPAILTAARALALRSRSAVILVVEPTTPEAVRSFAPPEVLRRSPPELAEWLGVHPRLASEVDTLLALAPVRARFDQSFSTVQVAVAKHRSGVPSWATLRFNGSWFEDETDLDLGI